ncbi:hypothetical protein SAMN05444407_10716 [Chryseobacterium contaminans]|uniref:Uncharacterized protein n=1 Tax=Chryseobacterium contaminans TaxID=1423959 RepID=A0A1M7E4C0_9FLAO|nr:hypothetical protein SAMN05444407_10716 [Chryseobacterium contaminans]
MIVNEKLYYIWALKKSEFSKKIIYHNETN